MGFQSSVNSVLNTVIGASIAKSAKETKELAEKHLTDIPAFTEEEKAEVARNPKDYSKEAARPSEDFVGPMPSVAQQKSRQEAEMVMLEDNQDIGTLSENEITDIYNEYLNKYTDEYMKEKNQVLGSKAYTPYLSDLESARLFRMQEEQTNARTTQNENVKQRLETLKNYKSLQDIPGLAYSSNSIRTSSFKGNASQSGVSKNRVIENIQEPYVKGGKR